MPLVNENKAKKPGQGTQAIPKQGDKQKTLQKKADQPKPDKQPKASEQKSDKQQKVKTEQKPDKQQKATTEKKPDKQQKTTEKKPDKQQKTTEKKPDNQQKATEKKPDKIQKTTEKKPDKIQKTTEKKSDKQQKATEQKPDKKPKTTEQKQKSTKQEQPIPKVSKVDDKVNKTNQASTSKVGPKNKSKKDDTIKFQGNLYNFVASPRYKDPICYACGKHIKSSLYHCEAKGRYLHPFCCKLKPMIKDTNRSYTLVQTSSIICKCCNIKDDKGGLSYVSTTKDLRFHVYCFMELIKDNNNDNHAVKGLKTEAFLEDILSLTNIAVEGLTGGGIDSIFEFMLL